MITNILLKEGFIQSDVIWIRRAGVASLFLYALFWLMEIEVSSIGESLMVLFFLLSLFTTKNKVLLSEPVVYLFITWVLFQAGIYYSSSGEFPELKTDHIREARILTNVFMFVIVAWWLGGSTKRVVTIVILVGVGYFMGATFQDGGLLDEMAKFSTHQRLTLGYINWEHASVYSTFVFLGLLTLRGRIISYVPPKYRIIASASIYLALIYSTIAIIATQTRATWLGLLLTATVFVAGYAIYKVHSYKKNVRNSKPALSIKALSGFVVVLIGVSVIVTAFDTLQFINKRAKAETDVIQKLFEGNTEDIRYSSIGIRIKIWQMGYSWFQQKPLTGWGPQTRKTLFWQGDQPKWIKRNIRHLHNSYIELLVDYGIIGLTVFASLFAYVWFRAWQAWKSGYIPNDIMLFAALWSFYWLIVNGFESYVIYSATGGYLNAIVAGILFTYHMKKRQAK